MNRAKDYTDTVCTSSHGMTPAFGIAADADPAAAVESPIFRRRRAKSADLRENPEATERDISGDRKGLCSRHLQNLHNQHKPPKTVNITA